MSFIKKEPKNSADPQHHTWKQMARIIKKRDGNGRRASWPVSVWLFVVWLAFVSWIAALFAKSPILPVSYKLRPHAAPSPLTVLQGTRVLDAASSQRVTSMAFSSDGEHMLTTGGTGQLRQIHVAEEGEGTRIRYTGSPDGLNRYRGGYQCGDAAVEYICGRPMSCAFDTEGLKLYVLDAYKGLLLVDVAENTTEVLYDHNLTFGNALAVSSETGRVYFTETSHIRARNAMMEDILEANKNGRVLMFDPASMATVVVAEKMNSPWGLAVLNNDHDNNDDDRDTLVLAEITKARLLKLTVNGEGKVKIDYLNKALPGIPFGVHYDGDALWVACMRREMSLFGTWTVPNLFVDAFHEFTFPRAVLATLREDYLNYLWPRESLVLKLSPKYGKVLQAFQIDLPEDSPVSLVGTSAVAVHNGKVYVSSFASDAIVEATLPSSK